MATNDYREAVGYLDSLLEWRDPTLPIRRTRHLLERLGNPQDDLKVFHVGGTSGKGSVATFIDEILHAAGFRVGVSTKPYLQVPIERVRIGDLYMSTGELAELVARMKPHAEAMRETWGAPRYLEFWAALAYLYLAQQQVDFAVVEVGMGGRYDYTNVITPVTSVITTVDHDHTLLLGNSIREIAHHKAGIVKRGVPVVTAERKPEALAVIEQECLEQEARLVRVGRDVRAKVKRMDRTGAQFDVLGETTYRDLNINLLGPHQVTNAATAVAAIDAFSAHHGVEVPEQAVRDGLEATFLPGRLEVVQQAPLVVLDAAHNVSKIEALVESLEALFSWERLIIVLGVLADKDAAAMAKQVAALADLVIATTPVVAWKQALDPQLLAEYVSKHGVQTVVRAEPLEAVEHALSIAGDGDLVCATGSLYLIGKIRGVWVGPEQILATRRSRPNRQPGFRQ